MSEEERPRFVADNMLGSLARWLRMLGYDTVYSREMTDAELVRLANDEKRQILTRDKDLASKPNATMVAPDDLDAQLQTVRDAFQLRYEESAIRCSTCNGDLVAVAKEEVAGSVPAGALECNDEFWRCRACGKVYWKGTHWHGIMDRLRRLNLA